MPKKAPYKPRIPKGPDGPGPELDLEPIPPPPPPLAGPTGPPTPPAPEGPVSIPTPVDPPLIYTGPGAEGVSDTGSFGSPLLPEPPAPLNEPATSFDFSTPMPSVEAPT